MTLAGRHAASSVGSTLLRALVLATACGALARSAHADAPPSDVPSAAGTTAEPAPADAADSDDASVDSSAGADADADAVSVSDPGIDAVAVSDPDTDTVSVSDTNTDSDTDSDSDADSDADSGTGADDDDYAEAPDAFTFSGELGSGLTATSRRFSMNLRARIQLRYQLAIDPPEDGSNDRELDQLVNVGTARLWFSGHALVPELRYMIQLAIAGRDFRDGAISPIYDAFLEWKAHRDFSIRAGQFFVPFDRLRTVREWALQLADRPRPVLELTLDRDLGVLFFSDRFLHDDSPVAWRIGLFGGGGTNLTQGREPGALFVARVELRPLGPIDDDVEGDLDRRTRPALAIGGAFAANWNTNRLRSTTGTVQSGTTDYLHAAADLVFKWRGLALQAEYLWRRASSPDFGVPEEPTREAQGVVTQISYVLSVPLELVARWSRMWRLSGRTGDALLAELDARGEELAAGVNYYLRGHRFKLQADWIARMPPGLQLDEADHVVHAQLDVTF
jgi:hypothetical protein